MEGFTRARTKLSGNKDDNNETTTNGTKFALVGIVRMLFVKRLLQKFFKWGENQSQQI